MEILKVPILFCHRCKKYFTPNINPIKQTITIPKACPKQKCRSQTWNIPDNELDMIRQTQNRNLLLGRIYHTGIKKKIPVLYQYKPKKSEKKPLITCLECELFFYDKTSLQRHQYRRYNGMCMNCHASNVYVIRVNNNIICKTCSESEK